MRILFSLLFAFILGYLSAQPRLQYHKVQAGQTAYSIARMYGMTVEELYEYNPDIKEVLREGESILVFAEAPEGQPAIDSSRYIFHTVKPGETVYRLTRQYDVTEDILLENNPELSDGLRAEMVIKIPRTPKRTPVEEKRAKPVEQLASDESKDYLIHEVGKGETVYSLVRKYNITATQLVELNPELSEGLKEGQRLRIKRLEKTDVRQTERQEQQDAVVQQDTARQPFTLYRIAEGDKLRNILATFQITREELEKYNPRLHEGLIPGRMLLIPLKPGKDERMKKDSTVYSLDRAYPKGKIIRVALYLPLDTDVDPEEPDWERKLVKRNEVSFGFYSGVKSALDSLAQTGVSTSLHIYSDKDINSESVAAMDSMDIIIGPVFYREIRKLSDELRRRDIRVPIVSPMSREMEILNLPNVYHCLPPQSIELLSMARLIDSKYPEIPVLLIHQNNKEYKEKADYLTSMLNGAQRRLTVVKGDISRDKLEQLYGEPAKEDKIVILLGNDRVYMTNNLNTLGGARRNDLILFSESELIKMPAVELSNLGRLRLIRPEMTFHQFDQPRSAQFFEIYRRQFHRDPDRFALQGFDVAYYFITQIRGREAEQKPLQSYFKFRPTEKGSYRNEQLIWISLDANLRQQVVSPIF
jgi:LysM repeat protein